MKTETNVYIVNIEGDKFKECPTTWDDNKFIEIAREQCGVYTLNDFEKLFNSFIYSIDIAYDYIRFLSAEKPELEIDHKSIFNDTLKDLIEYIKKVVIHNGGKMSISNKKVNCVLHIVEDGKYKGCLYSNGSSIEKSKNFKLLLDIKDAINEMFVK